MGTHQQHSMEIPIPVVTQLQYRQDAEKQKDVRCEEKWNKNINTTN